MHRKRTSFERFSKAHNQQRADPNSAPVGSNRGASSRGDAHLGGVRSGGGSVFGTSGRSAGMQKKARARRAILGGDSDATAGACAARANADPMTLRHQRDQATLLSPVSSIGVKLDSMCHWNGTPGAPVGHPRAMDAANPGAMFIERARVNPESSSGPPTAEQTHRGETRGLLPAHDGGAGESPRTRRAGPRTHSVQQRTVFRGHAGQKRRYAARRGRPSPPSEPDPRRPIFQLSTFSRVCEKLFFQRISNRPDRSRAF